MQKRKDKFKALGIKNHYELQAILGCSESLAVKVYYGRAPLSIRNANKIKAKTGASLDYLLSNFRLQDKPMEGGHEVSKDSLSDMA